MSARSIQATLSRWFAVQALLGLSVVCIGVYAVTAWNFQLKQASQLDRQSGLIAHLVQESNGEFGHRNLRHKLDDYFAGHSDLQVVLRQEGRVVYASAPGEGPARWSWISLTQPAEPGQPPIELQMAINVYEDERLLARLAWTLLAAVVLGSLVIAWTGALLVRRGLKPLQDLTRQVASTGPAYPGRRIDLAPYSPEIAPWVAQFNAVLDRAEQAYQQLESFNADVAHELQTPLANLIGMVEVELARPRSAQELGDALLSALEEARRMSDIVADMLFLTRADRGAVARRSAPLSLAAQVRTVVEFHEAMLESAGQHVQVLGDAQVAADAGLVRRAVSNLLANACRHADAGSAISIAIERQADAVWVRVANRGEPIAPDVLVHLFERFFRAERSRTDSSHHHGLGLAIVAAIARMHGGQTHASSAAGVTTVGFSLAVPREEGCCAVLRIQCARRDQNGCDDRIE